MATHVRKADFDQISIQRKVCHMLVENRITIVNFPQIFNRLAKGKRERLKNGLRGYGDRLKWLDGRANFPISKLSEVCSEAEKIRILKMARFSCKGTNSNFRLKIPFQINPDLSYFLGVIAGDGYISKPKPHHRGGWTVEMCEDDYEYQTMVFKPLVAKLFGCEPKLYLNRRKDGRRNFYSKINSYILVQYLHKVFGCPLGQKADIVEMPDDIQKTELKMAFLSGLFDTDGTVTGRKVKFSTVSKGLFRQVCCTLESAGIKFTVESWKKNKKVRRLYTVKICKDSFGKFGQLIGFKNVRKKVRLTQIIAPSSSGQEIISENF